MLQAVCRTISRDPTAAHQQASKQLACSVSQGEGGKPSHVRLVRHTPSQQARTSQVFAANPTRGAAVLNSAAAAMHASDETVVQTADGTQYSRGHNPHDILFYPISPISSCVSRRLLPGGEIMGVSRRCRCDTQRQRPSLGSAVGTPEAHEREFMLPMGL